ncbi:hypothetical protein BGY98DRAFT_1128840 [Russula aff. rugulosa BPL654]|nr:hypothetical protein BGY98DRAFT_1128840 [Russula aff. rugulosa BPL654]
MAENKWPQEKGNASPLWLRNLWPQREGGRTRGGNASSLVFPSPMPSPLPTELPHFRLSITPAPLQLCLDLGIGNQAHGSREESIFARIVVPGQCRHSRDLPESRQLIHDQERGIYPCRGPRQCRGGACGGRARVKQAGAEHIQEPEAPPGHLCAPRFSVNVRVPCPCPRLPLNTTPNGLTRRPLSRALLACLPAFSLLKSSSRGSVHALHALQRPSPLNPIFNVIL